MKSFLKLLLAALAVFALSENMFSNSSGLQPQTSNLNKMKTDKIVQRTISINATGSEVWEALTNPAIIKVWLYGTNVVSEWKVGSPVLFKGNWQGNEYTDKGSILKFENESIFQYNYWSSFSNVPDSPENYSIITFRLTAEANGTLLTLTHSNFPSETDYEQYDKNWENTLGLIKGTIEK